MVILKTGAGTVNEREVEIVNEKGTWQSGSYTIFASAFLKEKGSTMKEPQDVNSPAYLGEMYIDKNNGDWRYNGKQLQPGEQKEVADFILDYIPPDGVW